MKNLLIGLFVIGLTNLSYSQNSFSELETARGIEAKYGTTPVSKTISLLNITYLDKVQNEIKPSNIRQLELMVFKYNIKKLLKPIDRPQKFVIKFIWSTNYIIARYDQDGKILSTYEEFKNFELPEHIFKSISLNHPNWSIIANTYKVSYSSKSDVKMSYIVKIRKGNLKKKIHIDSNTKYPYESFVVANNNTKKNNQ